jgi:hypothetical protein
MVAKKCQAITVAGYKCRNPALPDSDYCRIHKGGKKAVAKPRRSKAKKPSSKKLDRTSCRPKSRLGTPLRRLKDGTVIPTLRQYIEGVPEAEAKKKVAEYLAMDCKQLVGIARRRRM